MEITEEALKSSLTELQDLEKSHNATGISEPLKKADVEISASEEELNKGGGEHTSEQGHGDMYKGHNMKKMDDESDHDYEERMKKMKKMGDHDDMKKMGDHGDMNKMKYSQADDSDQENELLKSFQQDGQLKKAIDVSDFLKSLVEKTTDHLSAVDGRLEKSFSHLLEIVESQNTFIADMATKYEGLQKSFNEVLAQPMGGPRSLGHAVSPVGRGPGDLNKSQFSQDPAQLRKSILNKMTLACEKGEIRDVELIKFESTGEISNENLTRFGSQG